MKQATITQEQADYILRVLGECQAKLAFDAIVLLKTIFHTSIVDTSPKPTEKTSPQKAKGKEA